MSSSVVDAVKTKNETSIAKAVVDVFKNAAGVTPTPTPSPAKTLAPTPSPAKRPSAPTPSPGKTPSPPSPAAPGSSSHTPGVEASVQGATISAGIIKPPEEHHALTVGAIVGIVVGVVAVALMVAAFTLWYRRFKRASSFSNSKRSPQPGGRTYSKDTATADGTGDFNTLGSTRIRNNRTGLFVTGGTSNNNNSNYNSNTNTNPQSGTWDDPAIVANKIPLEKVETQALISRGGYGEVYRGMYKGQVVAIKKLLPATRKDLKHIESFFAEVKLMIALEHTRIVQFIGVAWDSLSDVCVLSEFMDGGDLRTLLMRFEVQEQRPRGFDYDKVQIALHVVHAMTYLHSLMPIVLHRDLKSKNILLDSQLNAKLTDFGVSREQSDATMTAGVGTSLWMAPEVMMGDKYDEKSDIFSFGVVLSELDSHLLPYAHAKHADSGHKLTDTAILQLVSMGKLRVEFSDDVLPELRELGEACVAVEPSDRPVAAEILYKLQLALKKFQEAS